MEIGETNSCTNSEMCIEIMKEKVDHVQFISYRPAIRDSQTTWTEVGMSAPPLNAPYLHE